MNNKRFGITFVCHIICMVLCGCIPYLSQGDTYRKYGAAYNAGRYGTDKKDRQRRRDKCA